MTPGLALMIAVFVPMADVLFRRTVHHAERVPATGGALLVANHISIVDPIHFARFVYDAGRIPRFLAKHSLFRGFAGTVLRSAGQIPVYRATSAAPDSLRDAVAALARGEVVAIYPEGSVTRDPDYWPMAARNGVARLALATDVPVIPIAQWGPQRSHDYHTKRWALHRRPRCVISVGAPVDLSAFRDRPVTAGLLAEVTDVVMARVRAELGEVRGRRPPPDVHPAPGPRS